MNFESLAGSTLGSYHKWDQDIYLRGHDEGIESGACAALVATWIRAWCFATRYKQFGRETFSQYALARERIRRLQENLNYEPDEDDPHAFLAERLVHVVEEVNNEGLSLQGATVTRDALTAAQLVTQNLGYFFIGLYGGAGHAVGAMRQFGGRIVYFDPNYGHVSWGHEGQDYARIYATSSFTSFFTSMARNVYPDWNLTTYAVLHFTRGTIR